MQPVLCDAQDKPARMHPSPVDGRHVRRVVAAVARLPGKIRKFKKFRNIHNTSLELAWI